MSAAPGRPAAALASPVTALNAGVGAIVGYLGVLTGAAWWARSRGRDRTPLRPSPRHRFAVLVPAHDEERLIATTVASVLALDYPGELVSLHVVADNCADRTAEIARAAGATVHDRRDPHNPGKGPALGWLLSRIMSGADVPDAVVVMDADSSLSPTFLRVADAALDNADVVQGFYSVRDPATSPATGLRYAALALRHYLRPLGRTAIGGSCGLYGNGMVFRTEVLARHGFSNHLTEDAELQMELLLDGVRVAFAPDAVVEAEMPATLAAARTQNERWELGRAQVGRRFMPTLARRVLGPRDANRDAKRDANRVAYADAIADHLVPPLSVVAAATVAGAASGTLLAVVSRGRVGRRAARLGALNAAVLTAHVVSGLVMVRAPRAVYRSLLDVPRLVLWKVALWARVLRRPSDVGWVRTARNEETERDEVEAR